MIDIDQAAKVAADGNRFALTRAVAKRSEQLHRNLGTIPGEKPLTVAIEEARSGHLMATVTPSADEIRQAMKPTYALNLCKEPPREPRQRKTLPKTGGEGRRATVTCSRCSKIVTLKRIAGPPQGKPPARCREHGLSLLWEQVAA